MIKMGKGGAESDIEAEGGNKRIRREDNFVSRVQKVKMIEMPTQGLVI